jgi:hypothetical protein
MLNNSRELPLEEYMIKPSPNTITHLNKKKRRNLTLFFSF